MTRDGAWTSRRDEELHHIAVQPRLTSNSSVALRDAALLGFGIACLPTYLVASDIVRGDLKLVLFGFQSAIVHSLYAMYFRS